jgi:hypothetical protein
MKKLIAALAFFVGFSANAGLISVAISDTDVAVGDALEVTVTGSGFDPIDFFSFELEYDTSLFMFDSLSLSGVLLDTSDFLYEVNEEFYGLAVTWFNIDFVAVDSPFVAAKFNLIAKAAGSTEFNLVNVFATEDAEVDPQSYAAANVSAVPAPATLGLFGLALLGLISLRRKA